MSFVPFGFRHITSLLLALGSLVITAMLVPACDDACPSDTRCVGNQCVAVGQEGDSCTNLSCADGLWCPPSLRCTPKRVLGPDCDDHAPDSLCGDGYCDVITRRCAALPAAGDDCTLDGQCAPGAFCGDSAVCVSRPREGERCRPVQGLKCALGLLCLNGTCTRPTAAECMGVVAQP